MTPSSTTSSVLAATVLPIAVISVWLIVSRQLSTAYGLLDWAALVFSLVVGVPFVSRLPRPGPKRFGAVTIYFLAGTACLIMYMLLFVGIVYGRWL